VNAFARNAIHEPHILADVQNTLAHPRYFSVIPPNQGSSLFGREDCVEHKTLGPIEDTPLSSGIASVSMHEVNLERSGCVGERVQASQIHIAELNSAALTAPTASERASWNRPQLRHFLDDPKFLSHYKYVTVLAWSNKVCIHIRRERVANSLITHTEE
jgi:hypothetical protein